MKDMTYLGSMEHGLHYWGVATPENIRFHGNLQDYAHQVNLIVGLQTGGKLSVEESYVQLAKLWEQLQQRRQQLEMGQKSE